MKIHYREADTKIAEPMLMRAVCVCARTRARARVCVCVSVLCRLSVHACVRACVRALDEQIHLLDFFSVHVTSS